MPESGPAIETLAIHAGAGPDLANGLDRRAIFEERLAALEGGSAAVAVASGPVARLVALQVLCRPGDEIVAPRRLSFATAAELDRAYSCLGWRIVAVDASHIDMFAAAISPRTKAILVESIGDSGAAVADLETVADVACRAGVPLIVDNTLATPALCRPFEFGAHIVLHSTAEFIAGEPEAAGGAIIDGGVFDWSREGRYPLLSEGRPELDGDAFCERFGNFAFAAAARAGGPEGLGLGMSARSACLALAGIETAPLRLRRQSETALALADWLSSRKAVSWVGYAGLAGNRHHNLARRYAPDGGGAVLTFGVGGAGDCARRVAAATRLFVQNEHCGGRRSSIFAPNGRADDPAFQAGRLRLSVGLENSADLIADLDQALEAAG